MERIVAYNNLELPCLISFKSAPSLDAHEDMILDSHCAHILHRHDHRRMSDSERYVYVDLSVCRSESRFGWPIRCRTCRGSTFGRAQLMHDCKLSTRCSDRLRTVSKRRRYGRSRPHTKIMGPGDRIEEKSVYGQPQSNPRPRLKFEQPSLVI
jgi:hypothetical protein